MPTLGLLLDADVTPSANLARDRHLLAEASRRGRGVLRLYQPTGDVLSLGRYHRAPRGGPSRDGVQVVRRMSGGRAAASGSGFLGVALALPHRSALVAPDPNALAPEQVLNRCVRGVLEGLRLAGVSAFYPGRDLITVDRRMLGMISLEVDGRGGALFEAIVAVTRDPSLLPGLLQRADPEGAVAAEMLLPDGTMSVAQVLGREVAFDEMAALVRRGYETKLDVTFEDEPPPVTPPFDEAGWLAARAERPELDRRAAVPTMLGTLEVHCGLAADGTLAGVQLAGDLIADSPAVATFERELLGRPAERGSVDEVAERAFAAPAHFALGVGPLSVFGDVVMKALAR